MIDHTDDTELTIEPASRDLHDWLTLLVHALGVLALFGIARALS